MRRFLLISTSILAFAIGPAPICGGDCGVMPVKPVVPVGCRDIKPACVCDAAGRKCAWQWRCVK